MEQVHIVDSAHGGAGWEKRSDASDLGGVWAQCGVMAETGALKRVIVRSPGKEIGLVKEPSRFLWTDVMDVTKAADQHAEMVRNYEAHGVVVEHITDARAEQYPNIIFVRDTFTMTGAGAILSRLAGKVRAGEECIVYAELAKRNIPVIWSAHGSMNLEGPDIVIVNRDLVFLGVGIRTNMEAVLFVKKLLEYQGYSEIEIIQTTFGCGHLDGVVNILNENNAVVIPQRVSYNVYTALQRHGFHVIALEDLHEINDKMAINFVTLNRETILMNRGAENSKRLYEARGVRCIEVDVSELMKGGGAVHCMTGVLERGQD